MAKPLLSIPRPGPLLRGKLVRRWNRFMADIVLDDGRAIVAHCVNTGRMEGLCLAGTPCWVSVAAPGRMLGFTWEIAEIDGRRVGANTALPNTIARRLLEAKVLPGFRRYRTLRAEVKYGENSRVDFLLEQGERSHYVEVKNCHLAYEDGWGYFPDSVSERATKHLEELAHLAREGEKATVLFVVQRTDARGIRPSDVHDPAFAIAARAAAAAGVAFRAVRVDPTTGASVVEKEIPVDLAPYDQSAPRAWMLANRAAAPAWVTVRGRTRS